MTQRLDALNFTNKIIASASMESSVSKLSPNWDFVVALYSVSIATSSLCLNGILLSVAYWKRKRLRTIDCLIINLAVSDIGLALTVFPLFIYSNIKHRWSFGDAGCRYFAFMSFSLGVASMMSLAEIAFMRYQMVCRSAASCAPCHVSRRGVLDKVMLLVFPYLHGITWATGPFFGWGEYGYTPYGTACSLFWHMRHLSYLVSACICCLVVPVGIMVFSYLKIIQKKNKSDRSMVNRKTTRDKRSSNLTMKTMSMCAAFVIAWTPYAIIGLLTMVIPLKKFPMPMFVLPSLCAKSSVTTNPILHAAMSSSYRRDIKLLFVHIKQLLCCAFCDRKRGKVTTSIENKGILLKDLAKSSRVVSSENSPGFSDRSTSL